MIVLPALVFLLAIKSLNWKPGGKWNLLVSIEFLSSARCSDIGAMTFKSETSMTKHGDQYMHQNRVHTGTAVSVSSLQVIVECRPLLTELLYGHEFGYRLSLWAGQENYHVWKQRTSKGHGAFFSPVCCASKGKLVLFNKPSVSVPIENVLSFD